MNAVPGAQEPRQRHFDAHALREDFPIFTRTFHDKPLTYLDSAASAQKPRHVIDAITYHYGYEYANVHRGAYWLSESLTAKYEAARETVRTYVNATSDREIVFTKGATEAINLVAATFGRELDHGDEIIITGLEHHSNIVPWQLLRHSNGVELKVVPVRSDGDISTEALEALVGPRTKLIAVAHVSNVLGTVLPIKHISDIAHSVGAKLLVDGCQGIVHRPVDVQNLDCDFYVFSGHKLYGPNGIGVLFGKEDLLNQMPPYQGGGEMISSVTFEHSEWAELPAKFEAGTPPIVPALGLGAAIDYVSSFEAADVEDHEDRLMHYCMDQLKTINSVRLVGTAPNKTAAVSFILEGAHPHDIATILDRSGVCVRAGHHCAQPLMDSLGLTATVRASIGIYNTREDIDVFIEALEKARDILC